ncbi:MULTISPECIES: hypothetical protein [unclassified Moorena]|uniref:hypothetical protein n=1 Tax=unclassified Moorena TaxID=2683338 RepID=UPI0013FCB851|nr:MULTISPECIES: hypothetical protein [unclassified Moorena]NEP21157.1 hypothetical protein [Moorena sp. SIO3I6]NEQ57178.1 hypothetical protein [Moorena sp. SIO4A1]
MGIDTHRPVRVAWPKAKRERLCQKARGFLDLRAAVNRRVPIFDAAKNKTIQNPQIRENTKFPVNSRPT